MSLLPPAGNKRLLLWLSLSGIVLCLQGIPHHPGRQPRGHTHSLFTDLLPVLLVAEKAGWWAGNKLGSTVILPSGQTSWSEKTMKWERASWLGRTKDKKRAKNKDRERKAESEEEVGKEEQSGEEKMEWKASTSFSPVGSGFSVYKMGWSRLLV